FFADPQTRVLYPVELLLIPLDPATAMGLDVALHFLIAMIGMYLFLRSIRVSVMGSLLGALTYPMSSFFYVRLGHPTFIATAAWIPWFFYAFELARRNQWKGTLLLTGTLAMGYLAGFPQVLMFGVGGHAEKDLRIPERKASFMDCLVEVELSRKVSEERIGPVSLVVEIALLRVVAPGFIMILVGVHKDPGTKQDIREEYDDHQDEDAYHKQ
ncbi:hypothetical protein ACFL2Z_04705, partial [Candidatus Eisenbacteria bacterium]